MWNWFKIFNLDEFLATELVSRTYTLNLVGIGEKDILVTQGNEVGMVYEGVFLVLNFADANPFVFEALGIYKDSNNDVFLGVPA